MNHPESPELGDKIIITGRRIFENHDVRGTYRIEAQALAPTLWLQTLVLTLGALGGQIIFPLAPSGESVSRKRGWSPVFPEVKGESRGQRRVC